MTIAKPKLTAAVARERTPGTPAEAAGRDLAADLDVAMLVSENAGRTAMHRFRARDLVVETKPDGSPVSDADVSVEKMVRDLLARLRPDDGFLGEETGSWGSARTRWILDPIDGTFNFVNGDPSWAVLLALEIEGQPVVGVVLAPALERCWWAAKGRGARADGRVIQTREVAELRCATATRRVARERRSPAVPARLADALTRTGAIVAQDLLWAELLVAEGIADVDVSVGGRIWDYSARKIVCEEAGAVFTDVHGRNTTAGGSALVTTGTLFNQLMCPLSPAP